MKSFFLILLGLTFVFADPFQEIDQSRFGRSLLDTISLQLNSQQSVDQLLKVLDTMRDSMNAQKEDEEHEHQGFQNDCAKDIDFYQQQIASATVLVVDSERDIDQAQEQTKIVKSLLDQLYAQMKIFQEALVKLNDIRNEEAKNFKEAMNYHDIATAVIQEAKRYFVQIRGDISFLQTRRNLLAQLSQHFSNAKSQVMNKKYTALFHIMAQMTSHASFDNAEIVAKILELCERGLENIADTRTVEQEGENEKIKMYNDKKKFLDDNIFKTQSKINTLEDQQFALSQHIATISSVLEDNQYRKQQNLKLMETRKAECDNEVLEYTNLRQKILDQVNIVERMVTLTETQLATMKQYLKERKS